MHPAVHGLCAIAAAAVLADLGHPDAHAALAPLAAALLGGLLPDVLERLVRRPLARADASFVPDPATVTPRALSEGVAAALRKAWATRRAITLRLHPLPRNGPSPTLALALQPASNAVRAELAPNPPAKPTTYTTHARLPAFTVDWPARVSLSDGEPVLLRIAPGAKESDPVRCAFLTDGWPHGLPFSLALSLLAFPIFGRNVAFALLTGLATHIALDAATPRGIPLLAPFLRPREQLGLALLDDRNRVDNLRTAIPAAIIAATAFLHYHAYIPIQPTWPISLVTCALLAHLLKMLRK